MGRNVLIHYGTKGMKWGVNRYRNPDGTLNAMGMRRYLDEHPNSNTNSPTYKQNAANRVNRYNSLGYETVSQIGRDASKLTNRYTKNNADNIYTYGKLADEKNRRINENFYKYDKDWAKERLPKVQEHFKEDYGRTALPFQRANPRYSEGVGQKAHEKSMNVSKSRYAGLSARNAVSGAANSASKWAGNAAKDVSGAAKNAYGAASNAAKNAYNTASSAVKNAYNDASSAAKNAYNNASNTAKNALYGKQTMITRGAMEGNMVRRGGTVNAAKNAYNTASDAAKNAYNDASKWAGNAAKDVSKAVSGAADKVSDVATDSFDKAKGFINGVFGKKKKNK